MLIDLNKGSSRMYGKGPGISNCGWQGIHGGVTSREVVRQVLNAVIAGSKKTSDYPYTSNLLIIQAIILYFELLLVMSQ